MKQQQRVKLARDFYLDEFTRSEKATELGIDNTPPTEAIEKLRDLVQNVLQPVREKYGKPITINSGYRCPELNEAVGGAPTSQHMTGEAADLDTGSKAGNVMLYTILLGLPFDQLINEKDLAWIHVSFRKKNNRHQKLKK